MSQNVFAADLVVHGVGSDSRLLLSISRGLCFCRLREAEAYLATEMTFIERYVHGVPDLVGQLRLALPGVHRLCESESGDEHHHWEN
jgi:hypothetical protein